MKKINFKLFQMGGIPRYFEKQNICVCGMMGTGKDVLFGNVIHRIGRPYISNLDYGGDRIVWKPWMLNFNNTWQDMLNDAVKRYVHIFPDKWHMYISDIGIYLPSQVQGELCKQYPYIPTSIPMMRQVAGGWFHANAQTPNRIWDKVREHFDLWIMCKWCYLPFSKTKIPILRDLVFQKVIIYDKYESAVSRVPVFPLKRPLLNRDRQQLYDIQKSNYLIAHGMVKPKILIYRNKSKHDTRGFKEMFANA